MSDKKALVSSKSIKNVSTVAKRVEVCIPDASPSGDGVIHCQVCQHIISLKNKTHFANVKCPDCGEATPIKPPPADRIHIRCPCNCLLLARPAATKVGCPRPQCKRVIEMSKLGLASGVQAPGENVTSGHQLVDVTCTFCSSTFFIKLDSAGVYAKCPHCSKKSSVGPAYARLRAILFMSAGLLFLLIGLGVTVSLT